MGITALGLPGLPLAVIGAINASKVRDLFAGAIGRSLTQDEIRAAFDESFGAGAGERVRVSCSRDGNRRLIGELTIGLVMNFNKLERKVRLKKVYHCTRTAIASVHNDSKRLELIDVYVGQEVTNVRLGVI